LEPNDEVERATLVEPDIGMTGRLETSAPDYFRAHIEGEPQLWEVVASGPGVGLSWVRTDGVALGVGVDPDSGGERSLLTDVYLIPGDHWFRVHGSGDYTLAMTPLGPPIPGGEREPNNDLAVAEPLPIGGSMTGRIGTASDWDVYRFSLASPSSSTSCCLPETMPSASAARRRRTATESRCTGRIPSTWPSTRSPTTRSHRLERCPMTSA
jgi:hypothetical protein